MAPSCRFLCSSRRYHLTDDARQHGSGVLPAYQVEALASLVDEVERMSAVGEGAVRRRREQQPCERGRRIAVGDGGEQGAFGGFAMAHGAPVPQPSLEGGKVGLAGERRAFPSRRLAIAVRGDASGSVEQRKIALLFRQHGKHIAEGGEDGRADSPAIAVAHREQRGLP